MNVVPLTVATGRITGSSSSRRLRADGHIPATVYGMGADPVSVVVERSELRRALTTPAGVNALIQLKFGDQTDYTLVKEIQRHPVRRDPIHIDFQRIDPEQPMSLDVPIVLTGEPKKVTANGGMVDQTLNLLRVSVRPDSIPNQFTVDISSLEIDQTITVGEVSLPAGVTSEADEGDPVVVASLTRAAQMALRVAAGGEDTDASAPNAGAATDAADDAGASASGDA